MAEDNYSFKELVDIEKLRTLFESFTAATGFTTGLVDQQTNEVLIGTGWRDICTKFHRACDASVQHCKSSNKKLTSGLDKPGEIRIDYCENGLIDGSTPIIIEGKHLANLFTGQILFSPPDIERFKKQAKKFDYDEKAYLEALKKVPVVDEKIFIAKLNFLALLATMIAEIGLTELRIKIANEDTSKQKVLLDSLINSIPDLIFYKDKQSVYIGGNKAFEEYAGRSMKDIIGKTDFDMFPKETAEFFREKDRKILEEIRALSNEEWIEYPDGRRVLLDTLKTPYYSPNGTVLGLIGVSRDITKMKKAEDDLKESEKRYRRIFEESKDVIFVSTKEGRFLDMNPAGLQLFGYSSLEDIQKIDIPLNLYQNHSDRIKYLERIKEFGFVKDYELTLKKKDGSEVIVLETTTAIYDDEKNIIACRGIMRDVTEKRRLEEQLNQAQKMESIGTLAGGVAHDFNNLLTVINGYAEMALMQIDETNPLHKDILSIQQAGKRAETLTGQLLAFSRKQIYKTEIVEINLVISSIDKMLRRLIGEDISINTVLTDGLPNIKADKSQIEQIFINLVVNARDAIRAVTKADFLKKITIETGQVYLDKDYVSKHSGSQQGRHIFFAVSDNGIGMDEQTKQKIFEPFFTTKAKFKGTGLGMSMVYGIVKQNNGSVYVYSEPGEGTMFKIYWPSTDEKHTAVKEITSNENIYGSETILFVEDDENVCSFATKALTNLGYKVFKATNGRLALELIENEKLKFDLVITDLIMPELNGKEFVDKVKRIVPLVSVIYVSGYTDNHIVHNGLLDEDINFIHKPYSVQVLATKVRQVLDS